tara:strand:+ start:481 stop:903 length:423 start_codon:yes stop_codon:yes gene_type:complete
MLNLKYFIVVMIAFLLGTQSNFNQPFKKKEEPPKQLETDKLRVLVTHKEETYLMEINSVPPPFDIAGNFPYVLWINGKHIPSPPHKDLNNVIAKVGKSNIPSIDPVDIHKGWIEPHYVKITNYLGKAENEDRGKNLNDKP